MSAWKSAAIVAGVLLAAWILVPTIAVLSAYSAPHDTFEGFAYGVVDLPEDETSVIAHLNPGVIVEEDAEDDGGYYEEYYEPDYYEPTYHGGNDYGNSFKQEGVAYDENYEYTWYSQNVLNGGGLDELNANGRHVDESTGFIVDGDGYIAVAMNGVDQGTVIDTKWGQAKVYDTKDDDAPYDGSVDVYTDF